MNSIACCFAMLWLPALILGVWQWFRKPDSVAVSVSRDNAVEGAKLLREWCTWLATISTTALGVVAFTESGLLPEAEKLLARLAVASFASSVLFTATLLLALPSLVARLSATDCRANDLHEMPAFLWVPRALRPVARVGYLATAQYYFFIAAIAMVSYGYATGMVDP